MGIVTRTVRMQRQNCLGMHASGYKNLQNTFIPKVADDVQCKSNSSLSVLSVF